MAAYWATQLVHPGLWPLRCISTFRCGAGSTMGIADFLCMVCLRPFEECTCRIGGVVSCPLPPTLRDRCAAYDQRREAKGLPACGGVYCGYESCMLTAQQILDIQMGMEVKK